MANKIVKGMKKAVRGVRRKVRAARGAMAQVTTQLDAHAISAAQMLEDPCNASLAPGCYTGDQGFRTRLVRNITTGTGVGIINVAIAYIPGSAVVWVLNASSSGALTAWTNLGVIGGSYLTTNAASLRCLGACVSTTPNAANLAVSGQVFTNIVPSSSLNFSTTDSIDNLTALCSSFGKISIDTPVETKFVPAAADENYCQPGVVSDANDQNVILQVFVGMPATTGVLARVTGIVEWKPVNGLALVSESFLGNPSRNTIEHVKEYMRKKHPKWFTNVGNMAYSVIRGYATGGTMGAVSSAARSISNFK